MHWKAHRQRRGGKMVSYFDMLPPVSLSLHVCRCNRKRLQHGSLNGGPLNALKQWVDRVYICVHMQQIRAALYMLACTLETGTRPTRSSFTWPSSPSSIPTRTPDINQHYGRHDEGWPTVQRKPYALSISRPRRHIRKPRSPSLPV